jgi:hypothetical protein
MSIRPVWLEQLLDQEVIQKIDNDPRTVPGTFLGHPKNQIFAEVIGFGQADFDEPVLGLSGDDRALLYTRYNQPRHLDELIHAWTCLFATASLGGRPTVVDVGCGPFTAGLALGAVLGANREFRYYGLDRARSMCLLGARLAASARILGGLDARTTVSFSEDLAEIDFGPIRNDLTIVVASYLLASPTLDIAQLVSDILNAVRRVGPGPSAILCTNSANEAMNRNYDAFRDGLVAEGFEVRVEDVETFYETKTPKRLFYAILYRKAETTINLGAAVK